MIVPQVGILHNNINVMLLWPVRIIFPTITGVLGQLNVIVACRHFNKRLTLLFFLECLFKCLSDSGIVLHNSAKPWILLLKFV